MKRYRHNPTGDIYKEKGSVYECEENGREVPIYIVVHSTSGDWTRLIPIITTEDGVELKQNDKAFEVKPNDLYIQDFEVDYNEEYYDSDYWREEERTTKTFSTLTQAQAYVITSFKIFTWQDLYTAFAFGKKGSQEDFDKWMVEISMERAGFKPE
jgi:hypothetical protein